MRIAPTMLNSVLKDQRFGETSVKELEKLNYPDAGVDYNFRLKFD